jgi:hypothetical protein
VGFTRGRKEGTGKHRSSDRRSCFYAPGSGFDLPSSSGTSPFRPEVALPAPLHRRRCGLRAPTRLQLLGLARVTVVPAPGSASHWRDRVPRLVALATRVLALRRSPCISERASSEVPGCGHVSCRSARGSVPASAAPSPLAADPSPAIGLSCDASVRRPLTARLPAARDGAVSAGHLPPVQRRGTRPHRAAAWRGESGESRRSRSNQEVSAGTDTISAVDLVVGAGKVDPTLESVERARPCLPNRRRARVPRLRGAHAARPAGARGPHRRDSTQLGWWEPRSGP